MIMLRCVLNLCVVSILLVHVANRRYLFENGDYDQFNLELMKLDWNGLFYGLANG